jgi:hypothetical protein
MAIGWLTRVDVNLKRSVFFRASRTAADHGHFPFWRDLTRRFRHGFFSVSLETHDLVAAALALARALTHKRQTQ